MLYRSKMHNLFNNGLGFNELDTRSTIYYTINGYHNQMKIKKGRYAVR